MRPFFENTSMVDITEFNPIEQALEHYTIEKLPASYIGMSGLGNPCQRKIWLDFHWASKGKLTPKQVRIFERGDLEERRVIQDLERAGMRVHSMQKEWIDDTGHVRGHIDGIVENVPGAEKTPHLLEIKTMNDDRFKQYKKNGLQLSNPSYYVQMHSYMGAFHLTRCLYIITNKDNEERIYHRYKYKKEVFEEYQRLAFNLLVAEKPPELIYNRHYFVCKGCMHYNYCHNNQDPVITCRTCSDVVIENEGKFSCNFHNKYLNPLEQRTACPEYTKDPNV